MISLKISKLSKSYNQTLLSDINLSHSGNGVVALIGDNGSGKSTLLKILAEIEEADSGRVEWSYSPRIGYLPQEIVGLDMLSGGQKKLALLSEMIYSNLYDVLLLDEPDNHLDISNKDWLINAIQSFSGLIIIISHDRHLLREVSTHTWLVEDHDVRTYTFGYDRFVRAYSEEQDSLAHLYHVQQKEHSRLADLVDTFRQRAASGPKTARYYHALQKRLARFESGMVANPHLRDQAISLSAHITAKQIKHKLAINIRELCFSYPDRQIFSNAEMYVEVGEKVAFNSPNGSGKSTLIRLLMGQLEPQSGIAKIGDNLRIGYYSQDHLDSLPPDSTPLQCLTSRYPLRGYQALEVLRRFFFSKHLASSKVWTLSGGQKSRLQLLLFLYGNPDVLILDEPTNHLDIKTVTALEHFLLEYAGTVVLISHDRELVQSVCDLTYQVQSGKISLCSD